MTLSAGKDSGIISQASLELDKLESDILALETPLELYRRVSYWLTLRFNCSFILFYADKKDSGDRVQYYGEQVKSISFLGSVVEERIKNHKDCRGLLCHKDGSLSIPIIFPNHFAGYLFVGSNIQKKKYSPAQIKLLIPVARIINNSLIKQEMRFLKGQKNRLQYAFSRYVSPEVVSDIMNSSEVLHPGGKKTNLSIIFSDIADFTPLSETMSPSKLLLVLNMYLNEMSQIIINLGGTIDKYEGDAIMAFFGAPKTLTDHALRACLAAIRMQRMQYVLNEQLLREKLISKPLFTRIGINSGDVIVGNVGSMQRLDYTVIGNNVNITQRIEDINKKYSTKILVSEQTYRIVKDYFRFRYIDDAILKGVHIKIPVYELIEEIKEKLPDYLNFGNADSFINNLEDTVDDVEKTEETDDVEEIEEL